MQLQPVLVLVCTSLHHMGNQSDGWLGTVVCGTEPALDASVAEGFAERCRQSVRTCQDAGCSATAGPNDFCRLELEEDKLPEASSTSHAAARLTLTSLIRLNKQLNAKRD